MLVAMSAMKAALRKVCCLKAPHGRVSLYLPISEEGRNASFLPGDYEAVDASVIGRGKRGAQHQETIKTNPSPYHKEITYQVFHRQHTPELSHDPFWPSTTA